MTVFSSLAGSAASLYQQPLALLAAAPRWSIALAVLVVVLNTKALPPAWHIRYLGGLAYHFIYKKDTPTKPRHLFSPLVHSTSCGLLEFDINGHKSNSTYFADTDVAITQLISHLTRCGFTARRRRGEFSFPRLGATACQFHKEIRLWERYEVATRLLAWDEKWVYLITHFVASTPGKDGKRRAFASMLSKLVFKQGRVTVSPETCFRESGLLPEGKGKDDPYWTVERVEQERRRGMEVIGGALAMEAMDKEYRYGTEEGFERVKTVL